MSVHIFDNLLRKTSFSVKLKIALLTVICVAVYQKQYIELDNWFLDLLGERNNNYLVFCARAIYTIGDTYIAGAITAASLIVMVRKNYQLEAQTLAFATLGILISIDEILKPFFDRNRPPQPRLVDDVSRHSFPSGHAAGNLVLYFYLSFIVAIKYPQLKTYIYSLATLVVVLIGLASVYTKAHWLTDVLAGYIFGYLWLIISLNLLKFLQHRSN